ncbi:MAG: hypothetical protein J7M08_10710 [Planctomycetes bacterium]|nr:hypothetical protein [Planctomycetota bacterium]
MRKLFAALLICFLMAAGASHGADPIKSGKPEDQSWEKYKILVERNIFLRYRRAQTNAPDDVPRAEPQTPEHYVFLRGVMRTQEGYAAFLEDTRSGDTMRVMDGDDLLDGHVGEVTLDAVQYVSKDQSVTIAVGENLEKGTAAPSDDSEQTLPASAGAADILEKLKQRRQEELGQ